MYIDLSFDRFFDDDIQEYLRVVAPYYRFESWDVYNNKMTIYMEAKPWDLDKFKSLVGAN